MGLFGGNKKSSGPIWETAFRGMREETKEGEGHAVAGSEFWTDNHHLAKSYAKDVPGASKPNIITGKIDVSKFLHVDADERHWDNVPVSGIKDKKIQGLFGKDTSRGTTTRQITNYAQDAGYHGVVFHRLRDHPENASAEAKTPSKVYSVINKGSRNASSTHFI